MTETLRPGETSLATLERIYRTGKTARIHPDSRRAVMASAARLQKSALRDRPIYGVNTGFGKLAGIRIPPGEIEALQRNLVRSHCAGLGERLPDAHVRLMMVLKILALGRGASGVRLELVDCIEAMLARGVLPEIPIQGSVGASGDLAPLAHLAAVMIGEGRASFDGRHLPGGAALDAAGIAPLTLGPKEGLALLNGTQFRLPAPLLPSSTPGGRPRAPS